MQIMLKLSQAAEFYKIRRRNLRLAVSVLHSQNTLGNDKYRNERSEDSKSREIDRSIIK